MRTVFFVPKMHGGKEILALGQDQQLYETGKKKRLNGLSQRFTIEHDDALRALLSTRAAVGNP